MAWNTVKVMAGRLLEIRADAGYRTSEDVDLLFDAIERELTKFPPGIKHVAVVDWRQCPVMAPEAAERIAKRITALNSHTERSAALASRDAPVAVLQFLRVIKEARLDDRKLFFEEGELVHWLGQVLSPLEKSRLRAFLREAARSAAE
jgi:hypothetical protein